MYIALSLDAVPYLQFGLDCQDKRLSTCSMPRSATHYLGNSLVRKI